MDDKVTAVLDVYHQRIHDENARMRGGGGPGGPGGGIDQFLLAVGPETGQLINILARSLKENPQLVTQLGELLAKRRMENEGILESLPKTALIQKQIDYTEGFLNKLRLFFEL